MYISSVRFAGNMHKTPPCPEPGRPKHTGAAQTVKSAENGLISFAAHFVIPKRFWYNEAITETLRGAAVTGRAAVHRTANPETNGGSP